VSCPICGPLLTGIFDSGLVLSWVFARCQFQDCGRYSLVRGLSTEGLAGRYSPRGFASLLDEQESQTYCRACQENVNVSVENNLKPRSVLSGPSLHVGVGQVLSAKGAEKRYDQDELGENYRVQEPVESFVRISQSRRTRARDSNVVAF